MTATRLPDNELLNLLKQHGSIRAVARATGMDRSSLRERLHKLGVHTTGTHVATPPSDDSQRETILRLQTSLRELLTENAALKSKTKILDNIENVVGSVTVPKWALPKPTKDSGVSGVPTLMFSDLHWGEVVDPAQVGGVNKYDINIAEQRGRLFVEKTIKLLKHNMNGNYPGLVLALGGDMFDGLIHDELLQNSDAPIFQTFLRLQEFMLWAIKALADEFGNLYIPCVVGNHGRLQKKPVAKGAAQTNLDWLLYKQLQLYFANDKRIKFDIPLSSDCLYKIYNTTYCLTHGDQFKGGSGISGILTPLMLGDHRKRKRQQAVEQSYDYMVCGHFHQSMLVKGLIVNGSGVGYDEFAYRNNFGYEPPIQNLWITHPDHDITHWIPVRIEDDLPKQASSWVSWSK